MPHVYYLTHVGPHVQYAHMATTGLELKLRRVAADVRTKELAEAMGVTNSRISHIERVRVVTDEAAEKYLAALGTCTTKTTTSRPAA